VQTKDLDQLFKAMALHIDDDKLKDWADEMDEDGRAPLCILHNYMIVQLSSFHRKYPCALLPGKSDNIRRRFLYIKCIIKYMNSMYISKINLMPS